MKKPLEIIILEMVNNQPADKFPLQQFTLPDGTDSISDIEFFQTIKNLDGEGLLDARVVGDHVGRPIHAAVLSITLPGKHYLEEWYAKSKENNPIRKGAKWVWIGVGALSMKLIDILGGHIGEEMWSFIKKILPPQ